MNRRIPVALIALIALICLLALFTALLVTVVVRWAEDRNRAAHDRGEVPRPPAGPGQEPPGGEGPKPPSPAGPTPASIHLTMGNPSGATADGSDRDNFLLVKPYYALSYNNTKGTPNWVSWCLRPSDLGTAPRLQFYPDPDLPRSFKHVTPRDYSGSGFDRGHLCPRSDRTASFEEANATFSMANIFPQSPACNQKAWADLEDDCRRLAADEHQTLYLVAGPQGVGGEGANGPADAIAGGKVTVPKKCWKVALMVDGGVGGEEDLARAGPASRLIAVVMPNDQSVGHGWARFRTSASEVERLTGYRLFDRVPPDVIGPLKDRARVPPARPRERGD
jgi:endonuclease G